MTLPDPVSLFGATGVIAFSALCLLLLTVLRGARLNTAMIPAAAVTACWLLIQACAPYADGALKLAVVLQWLELLRDLLWFRVLVAALEQTGASAGFESFLHGLSRSFSLVVGLLCGLLALALSSWSPLGPGVADIVRIGFLLQSVLGLVLIEQLYRNTRDESRWSVKHLCFGLGSVLLYDFALYADGLLFGQIDPDWWTARSIVNAFAVPLIAISAMRCRHLAQPPRLSRQAALHVTVMSAAGLYLLFMATAGYYVKVFGGSWGGALRIVLSSLALLVMVSLLASASLRSGVKDFLARHFYPHRHDYQSAWMSFTARLAQLDQNPLDFRQNLLRAFADVMDSTGAVLWQKGPAGNFLSVAHWVIAAPRGAELADDHPLLQRFAFDDGALELRAEAARSTLDAANLLPAWLLEMPRAWALVPLIHQNELLALMLLGDRRSESGMTHEDRGLLRTMSRQAAGYLALLRASDALAEARQFDAFNRLSAFLVHDLKNVLAQLMLVNRNAERHRHNQDFVDDALRTVHDATAKLSRVLSAFRQVPENFQAEVCDLVSVTRSAVEQVKARLPQPQLITHAQALPVHGAAERLTAVLEHLLQNAQDATPATGSIRVELSRSDDRAVIRIEDTGCGMSEEFVQEQLFKPFATTKGKAGMGMGVYESLHVVRAAGGKLSVVSAPGAGTTFRISLPLEGARAMPPAVAHA
jgi:putative PEP-CTERM system histidine kinase